MEICWCENRLLGQCKLGMILKANPDEIDGRLCGNQLLFSVSMRDLQKEIRGNTTDGLLFVRLCNLISDEEKKRCAGNNPAIRRALDRGLLRA